MNTAGNAGSAETTTAEREEGTVEADGTTVQVHWDVRTLDGGTASDGTESKATSNASDPRATSDATDARTKSNVNDPERDPKSTGSTIVLVQLKAHNPDPVAQQLRLENRLDGPVLYPRRRGVPEPGWDRDGFEGSVPAETTRALGYACPAAVEAPPVRVVAIGDDETQNATAPHGHTAAAVLREHGAGTAPKQVVTATMETGEESTTPAAETSPNQFHGEASPKCTVDSDHLPTIDRVSSRSDGSAQSERSGELPPGVVAWFETVERRLERAERLQAGSVADATTAVETAGGLERALEDVDQLGDDVAALREFQSRARSLAERAQDVEVPAAALRRLA